jgi:hypothetical protein
MSPVLIAVYLLLCAVLGFLGRGTRIGAAGVALLAVIFTPLLVALVLSVTRPIQTVKRPGIGDER